MTDDDRSVSKGALTAIYVSALAAVLIVGVIVWALIRGGPDHNDLIDRMERLEFNQQVSTCLLLLPQSDRTSAAIIHCQTDPET